MCNTVYYYWDFNDFFHANEVSEPDVDCIVCIISYLNECITSLPHRFTNQKRNSFISCISVRINEDLLMGESMGAKTPLSQGSIL